MAGAGVHRVLCHFSVSHAGALSEGERKQSEVEMHSQSAAENSVSIYPLYRKKGFKSLGKYKM